MSQGGEEAASTNLRFPVVTEEAIPFGAISAVIAPDPKERVEQL
jgi:hypothetical protein